MFSVGDKIVYPMQGIGIITNIETKIFSGQNREYIIINIISNNLEIMIPADNISNSNIRLISDNSTLENVLSSLSDKDFIKFNTAKERYQVNINKFKSGSLKDNAEVAYNLVHINNIKALNASEKQLLKNVHKFLIDEISVIKNISKDEADKFLRSNIQ